MRELKQACYRGERALFGARELRIVDSIFEDGESPLKHSAGLELVNSMFRWKYPLWYAKNVTADGCTWFETARAGMWYSEGLRITDAVIQAPKCFRRCKALTLTDVSLLRAEETLWSCEDVRLSRVNVRGDYFAMNSSELTVDGLHLDGNYAFDGTRNTEIRNSRLLTKDAFWNSENVTVRDSLVCGEYLGWNSKNLTLINCTVESLQGLCYVDGLTMINCKLLGTTLAFEYSTVSAQIASGIDSVLNPSGGTIQAPRIGSLILERDQIDPGKLRIVCENVEAQPPHPEWRIDHV